MNNFSNRKKKNIIILVLMLLIVSAAYATLTTELKINSTTKFKNATWDIKWSNPNVSSGSVSKKLPTLDKVNTTATYSVELKKPGDFYEFTIDVTNNGTIDAMIENISNTAYKSDGITSQEIPIYVTYLLTYSDGTAIERNHKLEAKQTETYKVRVEFIEDIDNTQLPKGEETINFKFEVNYIQANSNAIAKS